MTIEEALANVQQKHIVWTDYSVGSTIGNLHDAGRVLAAEVRRLREERDVYEPAAKNWPAMLKRCEQAEADLARARAVLDTAREIPAKRLGGYPVVEVDRAAWQAWREGQK